MHHIDSKADGGSHDPDNLMTVCSAHHRAVHEGKLLITGKPSTGLRFWHADGSEYGLRLAAKVIDVRSQVFQALRRLGFKEAQSRRAVMSTPHVGHDVETLLRACLAALTERETVT